jgi:hypothetical protein
MPNDERGTRINRGVRERHRIAATLIEIRFHRIARATCNR